jgi:hypothetical protein
MSRLPQNSEPGELLKQLAQENIPSVPADASSERRDRIVRGMRDAVERTAESAEKARRFRRIAAVVSAAAGFLLLSGVWLKHYVADASVGAVAGLDGVSGTVVLTHDGKSNVIGTGERALGDGDALQTVAGARAHLQTVKSSIRLGESTELRVSRPSAAEERISLKRGRVDVSVDKTIETKRAVVVETPDAEVVVRGTVFDVRVEPLSGTTTTTHVHVTRGSVWVLAQGVQVALLGAGQSWSSTPGAAASEAAPAAGPVAPTPGAISARQGDVEIVAAPAAGVVSKAELSPAKDSKSAREPRETKVAAARRGGTLAEENRLFAAGVEARNRGDAAKAVELFSELLSSYPQSTLREVAQVERFRALKTAGQAGRASIEARRYLAEHPDGAARTEARDLALDSREQR